MRLLDLQYEFMPSNKKKYPLLVFDNHTFAKKGRRLWYCSKNVKLACKAQVRMDEGGRIVYYNSAHNHDPPRFHKKKDGSYVRL
ncbi:hypothetical protein EVAR_42943_1 [Eumeta japonica]|uniref:FLYWCH-type domain-containing protein n=1 Tax=Eumeta variegata TaxID=151549 RepID=A0A4C1YBQ6_EUMVA|nr:hypothetical protein EVAR_42943_1 [Eumeta japonica]